MNDERMFCGIEILVGDQFVVRFHDGIYSDPFTVKRIEGTKVYWEEDGCTEIETIRTGKNGSYFVRRPKENASMNQKSIIQDWVSDLGLRHQGVIVSAVRGCDTIPKEAAAKTLSRFFCGCVLNAHCGSVKGAKTYMAEPVNEEDFHRVAVRFFQEWDSLPFHYVMHFVHAAEIVGYYREDWLGRLWKDFYFRACYKMHITAETKEQLDARLNKDEASFFAEQKDQAGVA